MDIMEKVEQLREKADISYEEARAVLEETNGDLLDALILLEQCGKVKRPETEMIARPVTPEESEEAADSSRTAAGSGSACGNGKVKGTAKNILNILKSNFFNVNRKGELLFRMPAWAFVLILIFFWETVVPVMIIALLFDVRYSFSGKDDLETANRFMDKVGSVADEVTGEFKTA